jgi:hypothetical protein
MFQAPKSQKSLFLNQWVADYTVKLAGKQAQAGDVRNHSTGSMLLT